MTTHRRDIPVILGKRIRGARVRRRRSGRDFATRLGIDHSHLRRVEEGAVEARLELYGLIAGELGTSLSALLKGI